MTSLYFKVDFFGVAIFPSIAFYQLHVKFDFCVKTEEVKHVVGNVINGNMPTPTYGPIWEPI